MKPTGISTDLPYKQRVASRHTGEKMQTWRSNLVRPAEVRKHRRYPIQGTIHLMWQDGSGRERLSMGRLVDVSVNGIRMRTDDPIPVRAYIICNDPRTGIRGRGAVRHCAYARGKYEVGVEFPGGTGWHEPVEAPVVEVVETVPAWPIPDPSEGVEGVLQSHA
jgi:hypothetical protein